VSSIVRRVVTTDTLLLLLDLGVDRIEFVQKVAHCVLLGNSSGLLCCHGCDLLQKLVAVLDAVPGEEHDDNDGNKSDNGPDEAPDGAESVPAVHLLEDRDDLIDFVLGGLGDGGRRHSLGIRD